MLQKERSERLDQIQSQGNACYAWHDPEGTCRTDWHPPAHGICYLRGNREALTRGCIGEDLRCAGLPARRPDGVCARACGGCPVKHLVSWSLFVTSKRQGNRQKKPCFCKRYNKPLFVNTGGVFQEPQDRRPPFSFCVAHTPTKQHFCFRWRFSRLSSFQQTENRQTAHNK